MEKTVQTSATTRVAGIKLSHRNRISPSDRPQFTSSADSYQVLKANWDPGRIGFVEQFKVLLLNRANRVLGILNVNSIKKTTLSAFLKT